MEDKRKRTVNFTSDEKSVLMELVIKYRDVLENKKSDATTNAEKVNGWKRLSEEFNALSTHCRRLSESLKTCWENIKRQKKKQSASRKRELFKTGGGTPPPPPPSTGADSIIETILGPALEGLENKYDGDALLDINNKEKGLTQLTTDDHTQMGSDTETENEAMHAILDISQPSCSFTQSFIDRTSVEVIDEDINTKECYTTSAKENKDLKWEGWTPTSPLSDVLKTSNKQEGKGNSWLKRRRPDQQSLSDQLVQEKINLVKTLIENSQKESERRILILDEQLKQEKIKTQQLITNKTVNL